MLSANLNSWFTSTAGAQPDGPGDPQPQRQKSLEARIENALRFVAELCEDNEAYLAIFVRVEAERDKLKLSRAALDRARALLRAPPDPCTVRSSGFYEDFQYQAASWDKPRRVIAKIEWHPGELFPRVGFIVTNLPMEPVWVVRSYNQRSTAEQHIKEGKYAFRWTRLSRQKFHDNEVRLQLHALAYNLATFLRCIELPEAMADWSLSSLQLKLIKIGARVVRHARASPSSWPRWPPPARWCAPSSPPSTVFERHRYAHDCDPRPS